MGDRERTPDEVDRVMQRLSSLLVGSDERRASALVEIEAALRSLVERTASACGGSSSCRQAADRRFIREVIAPELEQHWARQRKDPR